MFTLSQVSNLQNTLETSEEGLKPGIALHRPTVPEPHNLKPLGALLRTSLSGCTHPPKGWRWQMLSVLEPRYPRDP